MDVDRHGGSAPIGTQKARVALVEGGDHILTNYPEGLSEYAKRSLESLGVEVMLGQQVTNCLADSVVLGLVCASSAS